MSEKIIIYNPGGQSLPQIPAGSCFSSWKFEEVTELPKNNHHFLYQAGRWQFQYVSKQTNFAPISIDFVETFEKFRKNRHLPQGPMIKALRNSGDHIIDATCGLGQDSIFILQTGKNVTAIERDPLAAFLLADAYERAQSHAFISGNLQLLFTDACEYLENNKVESVFLDPMYNLSKRRGAQAKEMVIFKNLLEGPKRTDVELFNLALKAASKRVIVKRPIKGEELVKAANFTFSGKSTRYDVYTLS